jgi:quercetin dioxygenase-like cupin family protein
VSAPWRAREGSPRRRSARASARAWRRATSPPWTASISDLASEARPPEGGILSRTLDNDERIKAVNFAFGAGEELSEHTASMPAILQILTGEAGLTLGDDTLDARPGTFVHMPAGLRHAVRAKAPTVMLLLLLKG